MFIKPVKTSDSSGKILVNYLSPHSVSEVALYQSIGLRHLPYILSDELCDRIGKALCEDRDWTAATDI